MIFISIVQLDNMRKTALNVEFSVPVSAAEKQRATVLRDAIDDFLEYVEEFQEFLEVLFESLDQISDSKQLIPIGKLIVKYKFRLRDKFNRCVQALGKIVLCYKELFIETKTDQIRDVCLDLFSEIKIIFIDLIAQLNDFTNEEFLEKTREQHDEINKYLERVVLTMRDEWIDHIDRNILGKVKLS